MHGGDIYRNRVTLDFSVNVNPLGVPDSVREALIDTVDQCQRYPDIRNEALVKAIREMTGTEEGQILCGNGASELLAALMHGIRPGNVLIPVPSFYGYERAARAVHANVMYYGMEEKSGFRLDDGILDRLDEDVDLLFLANPNNPTGDQATNERLEIILEHCLARNILVVVDECFIEFTKEWETDSLAGRIREFPNLIVVRSFTKIFAIPGVRLGYLICQGRLAEKISPQLPEWNVSLFAQNAGIAAAREIGYLKKTAKWVAAERNYLAGRLREAGARVYPSEADFLLIYTQAPLYDSLLAEGILIRDCSDYRGLSKGYYRVAVKTREENGILADAVWRALG